MSKSEAHCIQAGLLLALHEEGNDTGRGGQVPIQNEKVKHHTFLQEMLADSYFPKHLVGKGQDLLRQLAERIEREAPEGEGVYKLTHATTEAFNHLQEEFFEAGSEIETAAAEAIAVDIAFILRAYGYRVDVERAIGNRDW
jgi:hypothetical protein